MFCISNTDEAYHLYKAALDRTPDPQGLAVLIKYMDDRGSLTAMAQMFIGGNKFSGKCGQLDNTGFMNRLYLKVLARNGESDAINVWVNHINLGLSRADVRKDLSESGENRANALGLIKDVVGYTEWLAKSLLTSCLNAKARPRRAFRLALLRNHIGPKQ